MTERKSNRRDQKLEAHGINRKEWVAQAIALAGMQTGGRRPQGKRAPKREDDAPQADDDEDAEESGEESGAA
jgi:hypothetical protein